MRSTSLALVAVLLMALATTAYADGKAFSGRDYSSLRPAREHQQRAVILHKDGHESMLLAVGIEAEPQDHAVWIFPVMGRPEQVQVDLVDTFPRFIGRDPEREAKEMVSGLGGTMLATQILPACLVLPSLGNDRGGIERGAAAEHWGLRTEVIAAASVEALARHLAEQKAPLPEKALESFRPYLGTPYSLVVTWMASREKFDEQFANRTRTPCVAVRFPAQKPFFPLRPTVGENGESVPATLYVVGYVRPEAGATPSTYVQHYRLERLLRHDNQAMTATPAWFDWEAIRPGMRYTRVSLAAVAYQEDMVFAPIDARRLMWAEAFVDLMHRLGWLGILLGAVLVAGGSYLAGGLAGLLVVRRWHIGATLGLFNVLTIGGLIGATCLAVRQWPKGRLAVLGSPGTRSMFYVVFALVVTGIGVAIMLAAEWI